MGDDVFRTPQNYVTGLDLDRFEAGQSATDRPSRWLQEEEDEKAERAEQVLKRAVELASISWTRDERALWHFAAMERIPTAGLAEMVGLNPRAMRLILQRLRKDVAKGIELIAGDADVVQGTPQQRRQKPRQRRITRSESLLRVRLPGHERELQWLRGGSWIDLLDRTCRSNPAVRPMTEEERAEYRCPTPGLSVLRPLEGE